MESSFSPNSNSIDIFGISYIAGNLANLSPTQPPPPSLRRGVSKSTDKTKKLLPTDFEPTNYSVICGNKRAFFNSVGNRRFRIVCQRFLPEYMNAPSKHEKSIVVTKVMKVLHDACPVGTFVAFEKGRWWEVSDRASREKIGTFFRDCLADSYKSSSKNKIAERRKKRALSPYYPPVEQSSMCPAPLVSTIAPLSVTRPAAGIPREISVSRQRSTTIVPPTMTPDNHATSRTRDVSAKAAYAPHAPAARVSPCSTDHRQLAQQPTNNVSPPKMTPVDQFTSKQSEAPEPESTAPSGGNHSAPDDASVANFIQLFFN